MSDVGNEHVLHQGDHEEVIKDVIDGADGAENTAIANVAAPSATYVEAEALAMRNTLNSVLAAIRNSGVIPSA